MKPPVSPLRRGRKLAAAALSSFLLCSLAACDSSLGSTADELPGLKQVETTADPINPPSGEKSTTKRTFKKKTFTLAVTGDFLVHSNVWAAAATGSGFDFYRLIAPVAPSIKQADLAICHLETPLSPVGGPYQSYPLFSTPPALLDAVVKAGYDGCTTASNHTVDKGFEGLERTVKTLKKAKLKHSGSYTSPKAPRAAYYKVKGLRVASLSYTYGTNGMPVEKPWSVPLLNPKKIIADSKEARRNGADVVLVALHWGSEYVVEPTAEQLELARKLTKSPAIDLIYGHHAHVVQPYRKVNGKWVIFGLGNFLAGQNNYRPGVNDGVIGKVKITRKKNGKILVHRPRYEHTRIGPDLVVRKR